MSLKEMVDRAINRCMARGYFDINDVLGDGDWVYDVDDYTWNIIREKVNEYFATKGA